MFPCGVGGVSLKDLDMGSISGNLALRNNFTETKTLLISTSVLSVTGSTCDALSTINGEKHMVLCASTREL